MTGGSRLRVPQHARGSCWSTPPLPASSSPVAHNGNALPASAHGKQRRAWRPVTERREKTSWMHWRLQDPKFLRHTVGE
jgi:hypothetical protein